MYVSCMNRIRLLIIISIFFLLSSCGIHSSYKINKVKNASYTVGVPSQKKYAFEMINNRIVVPVVIQGRKYNFLFDTGASLTIDSELLNEIEYENIAKIKVHDANEKTESLKFVKLKELKFFDTSFLNQGAIVMDLSNPVRNSCINISGIVGASVMKDLIWQIDFEKQSISISNSIEDMEIDNHNLKLPFDKNPSHSPIIDVKIDGHKENLIVDTGSGSTFSFPKIDTALFSDGKILTAFGIFGGVFGDSPDTVHYLSKEIVLDSFVKENWHGVIEVRNDLKEGIVGLGFLKDYLITIDWINQYLYLQKINYSQSSWSTYGFDIGKSGQHIIVKRVFTNSNAYREGLRVGDVIKEIDDFNFDNSSEEKSCNFILENYLNKADSDIRLKVNGRDNYITLDREYF